MVLKCCGSRFGSELDPYSGIHTGKKYNELDAKGVRLKTFTVTIQRLNRIQNSMYLDPQQCWCYQSGTHILCSKDGHHGPAGPPG